MTAAYFCQETRKYD
uniref:Uncharacterized protein n=1 Tax=Anguilla anguilla TaxID=7936 RepID=A0A0E9PXA3_ANGAN